MSMPLGRYGILISVLIGGVIVFFFHLDEKGQKKRYRAMADKVDLLYRDWKEGPEDWACGEFFDPNIRYEKVYLQCNIGLLLCRLKKEEHLHYRKLVGVPEWNRSGIILEYEKGSLRKEFIFYDDCREVPLPERVYGLGEYNLQEDLPGIISADASSLIEWP